MRFLVDGMNVVGSRPDGWWRDRDRAMARLVDRLERWSAASGDDVTVVFERRPRPPIASPVIEIAHAPAPGPNAADDEIVRRVRADPDPPLTACSPTSYTASVQRSNLRRGSATESTPPSEGQFGQARRRPSTTQTWRSTSG